MEILKPYHNPKNDILITIADFISTLEQTRDLMKKLHLIRRELANQLRAFAHHWTKSTTPLRNSNNFTNLTGNYRYKAPIKS